MSNKKRLYSVALGSAFGLGLLATSSFAGPLIMGPAPMPGIKVAPAVHTMPLNVQALNAYRQVRAFWLSKSIVR